MNVQRKGGGKKNSVPDDDIVMAVERRSKAGGLFGVCLCLKREDGVKRRDAVHVVAVGMEMAWMMLLSPGCGL